MRHAGGQLSHRLHFLRLPQLGFHHQPFGDVFDRDDHAINFIRGVKKRRGVGREQSVMVIGANYRIADILRHLAGIKDLFQQRGRLSQRIAFQVGRAPIQNTAGSSNDGVLGQTQHLLGPMVGKSDFSRLVGHDNADGARFHDAADEITVTAETFLGALAFDGIADGAFQFVGVQLAFDQVIGGPGLHGFQINFVIALAGKKNHRRPAAKRLRFAQQLKSGPLTQAIIQQTDVVFATLECRQRGIVSVNPFKLMGEIPDLRNQIARDDVIILIIIHQQNSDGVGRHKCGITPHPAGV